MNEIVERLAQAICADEKQEWKQLEISPHGREYLDSLRVRARRYAKILEGPVTTFSPHDLDPRIGTSWPDAAARGK